MGIISKEESELEGTWEEEAQAQKDSGTCSAKVAQLGGGLPRLVLCVSHWAFLDGRFCGILT